MSLSVAVSKQQAPFQHRPVASRFCNDKDLRSRLGVAAVLSASRLLPMRGHCARGQASHSRRDIPCFFIFHCTAWSASESPKAQRHAQHWRRVAMRGTGDESRHGRAGASHSPVSSQSRDAAKARRHSASSPVPLAQPGEGRPCDQGSCFAASSPSLSSAYPATPPTGGHCHIDAPRYIKFEWLPTTGFGASR